MQIQSLLVVLLSMIDKYVEIVFISKITYYRACVSLFNKYDYIVSIFLCAPMKCCPSC